MTQFKIVVVYFKVQMSGFCLLLVEILRICAFNQWKKNPICLNTSATTLWFLKISLFSHKFKFSYSKNVCLFDKQIIRCSFFVNNWIYLWKSGRIKRQQSKYVSTNYNLFSNYFRTKMSVFWFSSFCNNQCGFLLIESYHHFDRNFRIFEMLLEKLIFW